MNNRRKNAVGRRSPRRREPPKTSPGTGHYRRDGEGDTGHHGLDTDHGRKQITDCCFQTIPNFRERSWEKLTEDVRATETTESLDLWIKLALPSDELDHSKLHRRPWIRTKPRAKTAPAEGSEPERPIEGEGPGEDPELKAEEPSAVQTNDPVVIIEQARASSACADPINDMEPPTHKAASPENSTEEANKNNPCPLDVVETAEEIILATEKTKRDKMSSEGNSLEFDKTDTTEANIEDLWSAESCNCTRSWSLSWTWVLPLVAALLAALSYFAPARLVCSLLDCPEKQSKFRAFVKSIVKYFQGTYARIQRE